MTPRSASRVGPRAVAIAVALCAAPVLADDLRAPVVAVAEPAAAPDVAAPAPPPPAPVDDVVLDPPAMGAIGLSEMLVPLARTMLMLLVVVALAYLTLHKGLGKIVERTQAGKRVKVVERVALDQRRALYLVEVDGKEVLLAGGEGGVVQLLETKRAPAVDAPAPTLGERFTAALAAKKLPPVEPTSAATSKEDA